MLNRRNRRKSKRTYTLKPVHIIIKGHPFQVNDISSEGIGIVMDKAGPQFFIGERIENIMIPLKNGTVYLEGTVSHISVNASCTVCGIRFLLSGDEFLAVVQFKKECTDPIH